MANCTETREKNPAFYNVEWLIKTILCLMRKMLWGGNFSRDLGIKSKQPIVWG